VQLSHLIPPCHEIDLEELYHNQFTFQLERVHFSALNGSLFNFGSHRPSPDLTKRVLEGYSLVPQGLHGLHAGGAPGRVEAVHHAGARGHQQRLREQPVAYLSSWEVSVGCGR